MDPEMSPTKPVDLSQLSDEELIQKYCADRKGQDIASILWERHSEKIRDALKKQARLRPDTCPYRTFLDASFSRAYLNFLQRICGFRFEKPIEHWLFKVAGSAALDERRVITRKRGKAKKKPGEAAVIESTETEQKNVEAEQEEQKTDQPTMIPLDDFIDRESQYTVFHSKYYPAHGRYGQDPDKPIEKRERKYVVRELLIRHTETSDEDAESAYTIRLRYWRDWSVPKLAEYFFGEPTSERERTTRERAVYRSLNSNFGKLRASLAQEFGITSLREI
jgi:hypothetical protein